MDDLLYFPAWLLGAIPIIITLMKIWVPTLWREVLAAAIAAVATIYVVITTPLTLQAGFHEGIALFVLLTGIRAGIAGVANVAKASKEGVPMVTSKGKVMRASQKLSILALFLVGAVFVGRALAQEPDSTLLLVPGPAHEVAKETSRVWVIVVSQVISKFFDFAFRKWL